MPDPDDVSCSAGADDHRQAVALFRYGVIAELIHLPPGSPRITNKLRAKASVDYTIPGSHRTRIAAETIRDWLKRFRKGGFEALLPKPRSDRGQPRRLPDAIAENTAAFLPVFKQALTRKGLVQRLYVDNGANYRSRLWPWCAPSSGWR